MRSTFSPLSVLRLVMLAGVLAGLALSGAACASSHKSSLSEYEKLVARRRTLSATPVNIRAQQDAEALEAAKKADRENAARAEEEARKAKEEADRKVREQQKQEADRQAQKDAEERAHKAEQDRKDAEKRARDAEERARKAEEELAQRNAGQPTGPVEVIPPPPVVPEENSAPASVPAPPPAEPGPTSARPMEVSAYALANGDAVQIYLRGIPKPELVEDIIDEAGMVSLPFINEIRAAGLTSSELERAIRDEYLNQQIYRNMTVQVIVPTRFYYVQGATRGPGRFNMPSAVRLSEAIAAAGGGTEFWSGRVYIRRNGEIFKTIKNAKKLERTPEDDILLEPGDIVDLHERYF